MYYFHKFNFSEVLRWKHQKKQEVPQSNNGYIFYFNFSFQLRFFQLHHRLQKTKLVWQNAIIEVKPCK